MGDLIFGPNPVGDTLILKLEESGRKIALVNYEKVGMNYIQEWSEPCTYLCSFWFWFAVYVTGFLISYAAMEIHKREIGRKQFNKRYMAEVWAFGIVLWPFSWAWLAVMTLFFALVDKIKE